MANLARPISISTFGPGWADDTTGTPPEPPGPTPPTINSIVPDTVPEGVQFPATIIGADFDASTQAFTGGFGQLMQWCVILSFTPNTLSVMLEANDAGSYHVSVQDRDGVTDTLEDALTVEAADVEEPDPEEPEEPDPVPDPEPDPVPDPEPEPDPEEET
jgi:hypothetical protein